MVVSSQIQSLILFPRETPLVPTVEEASGVPAPTKNQTTIPGPSDYVDQTISILVV